MPLFLIIFLSLYTALHIYIFIKANAAFSLGGKAKKAIIILFFLMISTPIIARLLENSGLDIFAIAISYTGYIWMGVAFYFFWISLAFDLVRFAQLAVGKIWRSALQSTKITARRAFILSLIVSIAISSYAFYEAFNIKTEYLKLETQKLPPGIEKIRIAQISDTHVGLLVRDYKIDRILQKVKLAEPDILVSTGDLLDGQLDGVDSLAERFREINPPLGKYAAIGNHEYIAGIERAMDFMEKCGFKILKNSSYQPIEGLILVGVDDPAIERFTKKYLPNERELLLRLPQNNFITLLKHRPEVEASSIGLFDLQLSGHTHGGQIFPFSIATYFYYDRNHAGALDLPGGGLRYVNRGAGTAGPPMRLFAPPEVTIIDIVRK